MTARDDLARYIGYGPDEEDQQFDVLLMAACAEAISAVTPEVLRAGRSGALTEALAAIEDPARRQQAAVHFNMGSGLGWESARDIVRLMLDPTTADTAPDFFQPGTTYTNREFPQYGWQFRCDTITTHPGDGERTALGWRYFRGEWEPYAYGEGDWDIHLVVGMYASTRIEPGGGA